jgi:predicted acyltransferase
MRLKALDVFRGIAVAGMLLVNLPGDRATAYRWIRHAPWHGLTPADFVFPFFLFIVGMTTELSVARRRAEGAPEGAIVRAILRRGAILFAIGLFLFAFPFYPFDERVLQMSVPGVLQRVALCYVLGALLTLRTSWRQQLAVFAAVLLGYWGAMTLYPLNDPTQTLAARVDRFFLAGHLWPTAKTWDPEGILSTFPATMTTLLGFWAARWLRGTRGLPAKVRDFVYVGLALMVLGGGWDFYFPVNKAIWTSSYVLVTGGASLLLLAFCLWAVEIRGWTRWCEPLLGFGLNPIAAYVASSLVARLMYGTFHVETAQGRVSLHAAFFERTFASWFAPGAASLAFSATATALWCVAMYGLRRRQVFLKV